MGKTGATQLLREKRQDRKNKTGGRQRRISFFGGLFRVNHKVSYSGLDEINRTKEKKHR